MRTTIAEQDTEFTAPGPGHWTADATHWPRPASRCYTELQPDGFHRGFRETCERYGLLLDHVAAVWVNGVMYTQPRPVAAEEVPGRIAAAASAFEHRLWRQDLRRWHEEDKPASIRAHLALQRVDLRPLTVEELLDHIDRCRAHLQAMTAQHHRYNGAAFLPVGDFLVHAATWTGTSHAELLGLIAGTNSASGDDGVDRLVQAVQGDATARTLVESDEHPAIVMNSLLALPGAAGEGARHYLDQAGYRLVDGFDVAEPCVIEQPDVIVRALRTRLREKALPGRSTADLREAAGAMRERVPSGAARARFDELLEEARLVRRLRDERGLYSDVWAMGVLRRALLAAGQRLSASGCIERPEHLIEAGAEEVRDLLRGSGGPTGAELAARAEDRSSRRSADAPATLGDAPPPPPPLDALPDPAARAMRALLTVLGGVFADSEARSDASTVRGFAASTGTYEGRACVLDGPASLHRLRAGDVLITQSTSEAFDVALPLVGAIVTDRGGVLSHAGIVARECGIPAVVGSRDATTRIPDGARVSVDGTTGDVRIVR